jgi:hypothetical protein
MTDEEFEKLDAELARLVRRRQRIPSSLTRALASCRDCDCYPTEHYMLPRTLWLSVVPSGRGRLCLTCLEKRLGRPLATTDFCELPDAAGEPLENETEDPS